MTAPSPALVVQRLRAARRDPLLMNSALILVTTLLMAAGGALFWVIAARLASPEAVGLAGSLVAAGDALALFAQLGLNVALVRTMSTSSRQAADVSAASLVVGIAGLVFAGGYALLLPMVSPRLADVLHSPWMIAVYALLVAGTAINVLSDSIFLAVDRVRAFLVTNGIVMGILKCSLPFALAGAGAAGLYSSVGTAYLLVGLVSLWIILRRLGGHIGFAPSVELRRARHFAGATYVTYLLAVLPLLVLPVIVINALGPAHAGTWFISFQVASLLNAVILAVANATYAESERARHDRHHVVRKGGLTLMGVSVAGALAMLVLAPYFLAIFGDHYQGEGTATLRVLALATVAAAFDYWGMIRLRLAHDLKVMILVQAAGTTVMLVLAVVAAPHGIIWVAAAWGVGHVVVGVLGAVVTSTVVPFDDDRPEETEETAPVTGGIAPDGIGSTAGDPA